MKKRSSFWKLAASGVLAVVLTAVLAFPVIAAAAGVNLDEKYEISTNSIQGWPKGPEIISDTGIVMDADTGVILYEKGADALRYPASIAKLMTLLVAVENSSLTDQVTFTENCLRDVHPDSANIGMAAGEVMSMEDCLYAMMLASANEVSTQIAEFIGGTEEQFLQTMNERAAQLGCANTRFINANGLPGEGQYTTAHDMALISRACFQNETARKIIETPSYILQPTNLHGEQRALGSHHPMIYQDQPDYYYEGCLGGKTGNTNDAGSTLVSFARRDGVTYIVVVLRAVGLPQSCFDTAALFDYAYGQFEKVQPDGQGAVTVPKGTSLESLETKETGQDGEKIREYYFQDRYLGMAPVPEQAETPVEEVGDADAEPLYREEEVGDTDAKPLYREEEGNQTGISSLAVRLLMILGVMAALLVILLAALVMKKKKKKRKYRK